MTFVYPLLLGGLVLAGLPVLLHFLIRQRPKSLTFPAFRFLMQKRRSNTRNLRLRHLLLLLLRMALLAIVCLALARPRLLHDTVGLSREKPVALVLIFDTSPSMEYRSSDVTRLDLAKRRGLDLLDQLPEDGRVLILDTGDPDRFAREDWLKSAEKARNRIQNLTIQPGGVPVTNAVEEAQRRFDAWDKTADDAEGRTLPRFVCVFSDRTRASWDVSALSKRPDDAAKVQLLYFDVGVDDPVDLAITHAEAPARSFTVGEKVPLRVIVQATGKNAQNTLLVNVANQPRQTVHVEAGKAQTLTLEIDTSKLGPGLHQADTKFETPDHALRFNDVRHVTFAIREKQRILVLTDDATKKSKFADVLAAHLFGVDSMRAQDLPALSPYRAVFLVGVAAPSDALWDRLADFAKQGGGLGIILPGDKLQPDRYNSDAAQKVMPANIVGKIDAPAGARWDLVESDIRHSFLSLYVKGVAEGWDFGLQSPRAFHYWHVKPDDDAIVRYDDAKRPAVLVRKNVLLLTTPFDEPRWNNYGQGLTSFYLALPLMCARQLCPDPATAPLNFQFGAAPVTVRKAAGQLFPKYVLSSGDLAEEIQFDENRWTASRLPKAGNYTIAGTNPGQETKVLHKFSINVPGQESDLTRVPIEEVDAVLGKGAVVPQDRRTSLRDSLQWDEPIELFPWLMIGLLFLLALENLLANRFYRQEPTSLPS